MRLLLLPAVLAATLLAAPAAWSDDIHERTVRASAYTSHAGQHGPHGPFAAACGKLKPGEATIAVSRDLRQAGLTCGTMVRIEGFDQPFKVWDVMARRWTNKIDIYMGLDRQRALEWGVREVEIHWPAS